MKSVVSSFSMTIYQAATIEDATRGVRNRSAWIVDACLRKAAAQEAFSVAEVPSRNLMAILVNRDDVPKHIQDLLMQHLTS